MGLVDLDAGDQLGRILLETNAAARLGAGDLAAIDRAQHHSRPQATNRRLALIAAIPRAVHAWQANDGVRDRHVGSGVDVAEVQHLHHKVGRLLQLEGVLETLPHACDDDLLFDALGRGRFLLLVLLRLLFRDVGFGTAGGGLCFLGLLRLVGFPCSSDGALLVLDRPLHRAAGLGRREPAEGRSEEKRQRDPHEVPHGPTPSFRSIPFSRDMLPRQVLRPAPDGGF